MNYSGIVHKIYIGVLSGILFAGMAAGQTITTVAGGGTGSADGIPATSIYMFQTNDIVGDRQGNIYIAIGETHKIRKVDEAGINHTYAGTGSLGFSGDGGPATAADIWNARSIGIDKAGNIYFSTDNRIRMVTMAGIISTFAGNGSGVFGGDGGPATAAGIGVATGIVADSAGNIYFGGGPSNRIRKVDLAGIITTYAGNGTAGYSGDGGPATAAQFSSISSLAIDIFGSIFVGDGLNNRVRKIDPSGIVTTVAGIGTTGYTGDGGPATAAQLYGVTGLAWAGGYLYIAELGNKVIRQVDPSGIITTIAGDGTGYFSGDGGPAILAGMSPEHLFRYGGGSLYVCDRHVGRVRKITMPNNAPYFTAGSVVPFHLCAAEPFAHFIDTLLHVMDADTLQPITWSLATPPVHGSVAANCTVRSTGSVLTPSGIAYTPAAGYLGTDTFRIRVNDGGASDTIAVAVNIETTPAAAVISGADTICVGDTSVYTAAGSGTWSAAGAGVSATGAVSAATAGTATITYTVSNLCGTNYSTHSVTILPPDECATGTGDVPFNRSITISPNPTYGTFVISLPNAAAAIYICITDAAGRMVKRAATKGTTTIQLDVPPGIYFVSAYTGDGVLHGKVMVQ